MVNMWPHWRGGGDHCAEMQLAYPEAPADRVSFEMMQSFMLSFEILKDLKCVRKLKAVMLNPTLDKLVIFHLIINIFF